jgi:hypothetical protein
MVLLSSVLIVLGAMVGRGLSPRLAATAAVLISILAATLAWWYFRTNVAGGVAAGYGLYIGGACALAALVSSVWALAATLLSS